MKNYYERLIKLTIDSELFDRGEYFNRNKFLERLVRLDLLKTFNSIYLKDLNCSGRWQMWDFSDRFAKFAKALCDKNYCQKTGTGAYIVL